LNRHFVEQFFNSRTYDEMVDVVRYNESKSLANMALSHYSTHWARPVGDETYFPEKYLSSDLTAVMYGKCPVLFLGSNRWCEKPYIDNSSIELRGGLISNLEKTIRNNPCCRFCLVVVPEKDYLIDVLSMNNKRIETIKRGVDILSDFCKQLDVSLVFDDWILNHEPKSYHHSLEEPDSHLPNVCYLEILTRILEEFKLKQFDFTRLTNEQRVVYGDLAKRLKCQPEKYIKFNNGSINKDFYEIIEGNQKLIRPLDANYQKVLNKESAVNSSSLLILGDSHSSVLSERRLTFMLAQYYQATEFQWSPFGLSYNGSFGKRDVVLEISLRFLFSVPQKRHRDNC